MSLRLAPLHNPNLSLFLLLLGTLINTGLARAQVAQHAFNLDPATAHEHNFDDLGKMDMPTAASSYMSMSPTMTGMPMASGSAAPAMDMGGGCKISMLWNWYTIDSCFIARSWRIRSSGAFAASCIGVILLVIALEALRRGQREVDRYFRKINSVQNEKAAVAVVAADQESVDSAKPVGTSSGSGVVQTLTRGLTGQKGRRTGQLRVWQQAVRSLLFMTQFAVGYFVMLLAMYYNGYIIICIFIGAFLGSAIFQWDTYYAGEGGPETRDSCCM